MYCRSGTSVPKPVAGGAKPDLHVLPAWLRKSCATARTPELEVAHEIPASIAPIGAEALLLSKELAVFSVLIYKHGNQHRRTLSFRRLQEVK